MNREESSAAVFGCFDGTVSVVGFIFALLLNHASTTAIAIGGLGGAISATVSMGVGKYEERPGSPSLRLRPAGAMALATLIGSSLPVLPFFFLARTAALLAGGGACLVIAGWIGREKRRGWRGYREAYATLVGAAGVTLAIVALIPGAGG